MLAGNDADGRRGLKPRLGDVTGGADHKARAGREGEGDVAEGEVEKLLTRSARLAYLIAAWLTSDAESACGFPHCEPRHCSESSLTL